MRKQVSLKVDLAAKNTGGSAAGSPESAETLISDGLVRIRNRGGKGGTRMVVKEIAARVGCSLPTIHAWAKGTVKIKRDASISLALLDPGTTAPSLSSEEARVEHWMCICGHSIPDREEIRREIRERTNLGSKLKKKVGEIKDLARGKNISDEDCFLALSCKLGQERLTADVVEWLRDTHGVGTVAFLWRCYHNAEFQKTLAEQNSRDEDNFTDVLTIDRLCERFKRQVVIDAIAGLVKPGEAVTSFWKPEGKSSELEVHGYIQVNIGTRREAEEAEKKLKDAAKTFLKKLDLGDSQSRVKLFMTADSYAHPADCWVYVSKKRTFAVLVSESSRLMQKMEDSEDPEIKKNPYAWSAQIIHLWERNVISNDYLKTAQIELQDARISTAKRSNWTPLVQSARDSK